MSEQATSAKSCLSIAGKPVKERAIDRIRKRKSSEIVIGLCGFVGSGVSTVSSVISSVFREYGYEINNIKISSLITEAEKIDLPSGSHYERIVRLQKAGTRCREKYGSDVLATLAIAKIKTARMEFRGRIFDVSDEDLLNDDSRDHEIRLVSIVDNIKHIDELEHFRCVYGNMFFQVGVLCEEDERLNRLIINKKICKKDAVEILENDRKHLSKNGMNVSKVLCESDFFIENTKDNVTSIEPEIKRFVELLFGVGVHTPTLHEYAMCCAQVSGVRSACLSKQVGAAIVAKDGAIISLGRNDVPKFGGGLYCCEDGSNDNRCAYRYNKKCKNSDYKEGILEEIHKKLNEKIGSDDAKKAMLALDCVQGLKNLIEFSRAIHAEMDAITSIARNGAHALEGATLFCTTFPCHNCARHLVAAGIKQVYYIEPYDKSLAFNLHDDSIRVDKPAGECEGYLRINQFTGVAPRVFLSFFKSGDRKNLEGSLVSVGQAVPKISQPIDRVSVYEDISLQGQEGLLNKD